MKRIQVVFALALLLSANKLAAQTNQVEPLIFPYLTPESQSNIVVLADFDHPMPCPPDYTNLISNTNLFSVAEQSKFQELTLKYQNVTSNSGPPGSIFKGVQWRQMKHADLMGDVQAFQVACFEYTNSLARDEILIMGDIVETQHLTRNGDGYYAEFAHNAISRYQEYKGGVLDGLVVGLHDPNHPKDDHCGLWARFHEGKVLGKFIIWGGYGHILNYTTYDDVPVGFNIIAEAEFKQPFDFIKFETMPIDVSWEAAPTNTGNSAQETGGYR